MDTVEMATLDKEMAEEKVRRYNILFTFILSCAKLGAWIRVRVFKRRWKL